MSIDEYNKIVDLFSDKVYRFVLKNLRDVEKSQDIIQDSFEKLWRNVENVTYEKAKSYLFTTAYHTMIDMLRREKKKGDFENVKPSEYSHSEQYSDLKEILDEAVQKLPDAQRSVLTLRDYEGYSYQEIAEITGLNESQVKVYIYRARLFLKEYIGSLDTVI
ncbi:MAG: RNA polymerase sigma factor [Bacteroidales bacterium]|nr:RNA polymerase sigma factor [Bacteroidales bacterium]